jgi:catechol-2,3-dioxygenase
MIAVADVQQASRWYQQVLGAISGHGGPEYEQLMVGGELVMQLHRPETRSGTCPQSGWRENLPSWRSR